MLQQKMGNLSLPIPHTAQIPYDAAREIRALAACVHPPKSKQRFLMMLQAYCDESYNRQLYVVAGYLGTTEAWAELQEEWGRVLEEERIPGAKGSAYRVFHARDCDRGHDVFRGIPKEKREGFQRRFAEVISEADVYGFASAVVLEHYHAIKHRMKGLPPGFRTPFFLAFQHNLELMCRAIEHSPGDERIAFVFDRNEQHGNRALAVYQSLLKATHLPYYYRMGGLVFEDDARILPLQAADYLAYESFRYLHDVRYGQGTERWQWQLLRGKVRDARLFDKEQLEELCRIQGW